MDNSADCDADHDEGPHFAHDLPGAPRGGLDTLAYLAPNRANLQLAIERWPDVEFRAKIVERLSLPDDWRERVRVGADRKQSGTARENLRGGDTSVPDKLSDGQKALVNYAAPGLRQLLGYE